MFFDIWKKIFWDAFPPPHQEQAGECPISDMAKWRNMIRVFSSHIADSFTLGFLLLRCLFFLPCYITPMFYPSWIVFPLNMRQPYRWRAFVFWLEKGKHSAVGKLGKVRKREMLCVKSRDEYSRIEIFTYLHYSSRRQGQRYKYLEK